MLTEVRLRDAAGNRPYHAALYECRDRLAIRRLDFLEVHAVVGGTGRQVTVDRRTGTTSRAWLEPGRMFLLRPSEDQFIQATAGGVVAVAVAFTIADWKTFAAVAGLDGGWDDSPTPPTAAFDVADPELLGTFEEILTHYRSGPVRLDLVRFWSAVIPRILPPNRDLAISEVEPAAAPIWFRRSLESMRDEPNLRAGLPRFLELAHVSTQHLSATTRRFLGKTPTEVVGEIRLAHASRLLLTTQDSISAIAVRCGFSSPAYFSNCFRAACSESPRDYRRRSEPRPLEGPRDAQPPAGRLSSGLR